MDASSKPRPVHLERIGRAEVAVWANETQSGLRHNMTLRISYFDKKNDEWKETSSIGRDIGYQAARAIQLATDWIYKHGGADSADGADSSIDNA